MPNILIGYEIELSCTCSSRYYTIEIDENVFKSLIERNNLDTRDVIDIELLPADDKKIFDDIIDDIIKFNTPIITYQQYQSMSYRIYESYDCC